MRSLRFLPFLLLFALLSCKKDEPIEDTVGGPDLMGVSLIYSSNVDGHNELACLNNLGVQIVATSVFYDYWWAKVSPTQNNILYYRSPVDQSHNHDSYDTADLMIADLNGNNSTVLIPQGSYGWNAQGVCRWHPNGTRILMIAEVDIGGTFQWRMLTKEVVGGDPNILSHWWIIDPNFSPDGSQIVFSAFPENVLSTDLSQLELHSASYDVVNDTITNIQRLTFNTTRDHDPSYSPDGLSIVFSAGNVSYTNVNIMLYDIATQAEQTVVDDNAANGGSMCFSPDGEYVFFHSLDLLAHPFQIKRVRLSDGNVTTILSTSSNAYGYFHPEAY